MYATSRRPPSSFSGSFACSGGFTLLEMMVAIAMLSMLTASLLVLTQSLLTGAAASGEHIRRQQQIEAALQLLRTSLRSLAPSSTIKTLNGERFTDFRRSLGRDGRDSLDKAALRGEPLLISGYKPLFAWQTAAPSSRQRRSAQSPEDSDDTKASFPYLIAAQANANGSVTLCSLGSSWPHPVPLIDNLQEVRWKFLEPRTQKWVEEWNLPAKPALLELTLVLNEDPANPVRTVFWIAMPQAPTRH